MTPIPIHLGVQEWYIQHRVVLEYVLYTPPALSMGLPMHHSIHISQAFSNGKRPKWCASEWPHRNLVACRYGMLLAYTALSLSLCHTEHMPPKSQGRSLQQRRNGRVRSIRASYLHGHMFSSVLIKTFRAIGPKSLVLLKELGHHIRAESDEPKNTCFATIIGS